MDVRKRKIIMSGAENPIEVHEARAEMLVQTGHAQYSEVVESLRHATAVESLDKGEAERIANGEPEKAMATPKPERAVKRGGGRRTRKPAAKKKP